MKRLLLTSLFLLAQAASAQVTTVPSEDNYAAHLAYQTYFKDYVALKKGHRADIVFIGDSITEQWRWGAGAAVWNKHFEARAFDFGLGADRTQHTLWRLANMDVSFVHPKVAVIMIGTNNVEDTPEDISAGVKAVMAATTKKFAGVKIILVSVLPNARAADKMAATNVLLAPLADGRHVYFLNLAARFTPEGDSWKGLGRDKLHLTNEGYEMWAADLEMMLPALLK